MVPEKDDDADVFALDTWWLRKLGLWRGDSLRRQTKTQRKAGLKAFDFSKPIAFARSDSDPDGHQHINLTSYTTYDPKTGIFDDKIVYWRHVPWEEGGAKDAPLQDHYVLQIRGIRDPAQDPKDVPRIIPEQIWWNGAQIFDGPHHGGPHDAEREEFRKLWNRVMRFSQDVKIMMRNRDKPVHEAGQVFVSAARDLNLAKAITGSAQLFRGLDDKGWDKKESALHSFFARAAQRPGQKLRFHLPSLKATGESLAPGAAPRDPGRDISPLERLHVINGYYMNTQEPGRQMMDNRDETTSSHDSGLSYLASAEYSYDKKRKRHVYRHIIRGEDEFEDIQKLAPFDMARLEYSQQGDVFTLEGCSFMESPAGEFKTIPEQLRVLGFSASCNDDLAMNRYPDYKNHAYKNRLQERIQEMGIPPSLEDEGGEFVWFSLNGRGFEKYVDVFGSNISGGNAVMSRGVTKDGTISEVMWLHDIPFGIGGPDSDYDAFNANFMPYIKALRKGGISISHDHFDHRSLEYMAKQVDEQGNGWLKGVRVVCREDVAYIIKKNLDKIGVRKENYPDFVTYERPDGTYDQRLSRLEGEKQYAFCARDEGGNARIWAQICAYGTKHTAGCDLVALTGCYKDEVYHDTYLFEGDSVGYHDHGWDFMEKGQTALAALPGVSLEKLMAKVKDPEKLYILLAETTNITKSGSAPTQDEVKDTLRHLFRAIREIEPEKALNVSPLSTNTRDIRAVREICNEPGLLRDTTEVGTNMEDRAACMNIHGVDPFLDLRAVEIPAEKIPEIAYMVAYRAVRAYIQQRRTRAEKRQKKMESQNQHVSLEELLAQDIPYRVFADILSQARGEMAGGNLKSSVLYDAFFRGDEEAFENIAEDLGFARAPEPRKMPFLVRDALDEARKARQEELGERWDSDTACFMLRGLAKNGKITFKSKNNWNDWFMYDGIMRGQETVARRTGRDSDEAKGYRKDCGNLLILSTGAMGTAQENQSTGSRYAKGDSLLDCDEISRSTGYKVSAEKIITMLMQTPSMGEDSELGQNSLARDIENNRGNMVIQAFQGGFYMRNLKGNRMAYQQYFKRLGWPVEWQTASQRLMVGQPAHNHGHRFEADMERDLGDPRLKAKLVEAVHNPGPPNFQRLLDVAGRTGRIVSDRKPEDWVAMQCQDDPKTGLPVMRKEHYLTPSIWKIQILRKYGLQYGGVIKMMLATVMRRTGNRVMDALEARSGADGYVAERSPVQFANDELKPRFGHAASARQAMMGPSIADTQQGGGRPAGRTASSILYALQWGKRHKQQDSPAPEVS